MSYDTDDSDLLRDDDAFDPNMPLDDFSDLDDEIPEGFSFSDGSPEEEETF